MEINYNIQDLETLTDGYLKDIIEDFITTKQPQMIKLKDYYKNKTEILKRKKPEIYMPNNKIPINYQRYITDIETGYFLGDPIQYTVTTKDEETKTDDDDLLNHITLINRMSSEPSHNAKLSKEASKTGVAYELIYLNDDKEIKLAMLPSESTFIIRDSSIESKVLAGVTIVSLYDYSKKENKVVVNVYTKLELKTYLYEANALTLIDSKPHYLMDVPIIEYRNSDEAIGSYEDHIAIIDAYNKIISDTHNDIEQFANAILVIASNSLPEDEEKVDDYGKVTKVKVADKIKETRMLEIDDPDAKVFYLHKPSDNTGAFTTLEMLKANLLMLTGVPDFGEGLSGNLSAAAIKNALFAFEQRLKNKENNFKSSLNERLRLLVDLINFKNNKNYDYLDVTYVFTLNAPDSFSDSIAYAKETAGLLSKETRISKLVKDTTAELALIAKEKEEEELENKEVSEPNLDTEEGVE